MAIFQQQNNNELIYICGKLNFVEINSRLQTQHTQKTWKWPESIALNHCFSAFAFKDILFQQRVLMLKASFCFTLEGKAATCAPQQDTNI